MNPITKTYDADKWQLVPKVATDEMSDAGFNSAEISPLADDYSKRYLENPTEVYQAMLATAPQPPELSPWRDIETLTKEDGNVLLKWDDGCVRIGERWDSVFNGFICRLDFGDVTTSVWVPKDYLPIEWMSLPQSPEVG